MFMSLSFCQSVLLRVVCCCMMISESDGESWVRVREEEKGKGGV